MGGGGGGGGGGGEGEGHVRRSCQHCRPPRVTVTCHCLSVQQRQAMGDAGGEQGGAVTMAAAGTEKSAKLFEANRPHHYADTSSALRI